MERCYTIAGVRFRVCCPAEWMYREDGVLSAYRSPDTEAEHTLEFQVVDTLSPPEGELVCSRPDKWVYRTETAQIRYGGALGAGLRGAHTRIHREGNASHIQVKAGAIRGHITSKLVLNCLEAEHRIVQAGGFLLHASYICRNGKAILFTAPSGTGKSTQAELWQNLRGARILNGDRAAVMAEPEGITARGVPFAGSSCILENETCPLEAIVYLSQSPQSRITPLTGVRAFRAVWEGCSVNVWNPEDVTACTETVLAVLRQVPVFHLACTPDASAVEALEQALDRVR